MFYKHYKAIFYFQLLYVEGAGALERKIRVSLLKKKSGAPAPATFLKMELRSRSRSTKGAALQERRYLERSPAHLCQ